MKIAVYGATGMIGSRVVAEALGRGHEVVGVTRSGGDLPAGVEAIQGNAGDPELTARIAADTDVVLSAIGPFRCWLSALLRSGISLRFMPVLVRALR
jgi:putative NADH-flavin reductase